jgi:hypothetical protein
MTFEEFLVTYYIQTTLSGIVAVTALIKYKSRSPQVKLVGFSFLLSFVCNGLAFALFYSPYSKYSIVPQNIFLLLNICVVISLYYSALAPKFRLWLWLALAVCVPFSFYDTIIQHKSFVESYSPFTQSIFIITFTILYFYRLLVEMPAVHVQRLPMFWFNSAYLFFHAGTSFLWAFTSYLINVLHNDMLAYWSFHNSLSIFQHLIILIGLFFDLKSPQHDSKISVS